ncbi:FkbM family methyltransferase [Paracoccaceae bacterium]|nr:FkbM family methyltransferase [Paracoccaceae bacterium]
MNYNFYYPLNEKRRTEGLKKLLLGYTYPIVKDFKPKLILDVGANLGATSMFFAINYPKARIFSFEPTEMNFKWLQKNTEGFKNITRIKKGAYFKDTKIKIFLDSENGGRNSIYKDWTKSDIYEYVELINLGKFLESKNLVEKIDILKIDTEGCEIEILSSIEHHLKNIQVIYLEYHGTSDEEVILAKLSESHVVKQKKAVAQKLKKVNLELIGELCLDDVIVRGETILQAGKKITKTHIKELEKNSVETVLVQSDFLGEILFINKSLVLPK